MSESRRNYIERLESTLRHLQRGEGYGTADMEINRDNVHLALSLLQSFANGEVIEFWSDEDKKWIAIDTIYEGGILYIDDPEFKTYRIKNHA